MNVRNILVLITTTVMCIGCASNSGNNQMALREELLEKSLPEQAIMIQNMSSEERCQYWSIKLENTLASKNLTEEEKEVIAPLKDAMSADVFSKGSEADIAFLALCERVQTELKTRFGWNEKKLFKYFETIMTEEEFSEFLKRHGEEEW